MTRVRPSSLPRNSLRFARSIAWLAVFVCVLGAGRCCVAGGLAGSETEYLLRCWETEDGLPESSATAIVQDTDGYLWIGTFGGLVRFDGVRFTVLDEASTPALPSRGIVNLHLDRGGRLWVSTLGGMVVREAGRWRTFGPADGWVGNYVRTFAERPSSGELLFTTFDGHVLEYVGGRFSELPAPPGAAGKGYFGFVDSGGQWGVAQHAFVGFWDGRNWRATGHSDPPVASDRVAAAPAHGGGHWILLGDELCKYRGSQQVLRRTLDGMRGSVWSLCDDRSGNVWITTSDAGLYRLDSRGDLKHWTASEGLSFDGVRCVFEDREGNLWVGTSGGGLIRLTARRAQGLGDRARLPGRVVRSVSVDVAGNLWVATYDKGIFRWDGKGLTPVRLVDDEHHATTAQCVMADSRGRVWVGTYRQGLWRIEDGRTLWIPDERVGDGNVLALFEDSRGRVWCGGGNKVAVWEQNQVQTLGRESGLTSGATCFAEDRAGEIWLANREGVFRQRHGVFREIRDETGQSLRRVLCFHPDQEGRMWMGTDRGGVLLCRQGKVTQLKLAPADGAVSVQALIEDRRRVLWLATDQGILRGALSNFRDAADGRAALAVQTLDLADGLPSAQFSSGRQPVCAMGAEGRLWFASLKGPAAIDPARFRVNTTPPPAAVEALVYHASPATSEGGPYRHAPDLPTRLEPPFSEPLTLPPGSRRIEVRYTGLSFTDPAKVRFQVRLEGWDDRWQSVGHHRVARYHELSPGAYVFEVRAANNDGVWNADGARLAFTVAPYYWQTAWFRSSMVALVVATSSGLAWWSAHVRHRRRCQMEQRFRLVVEAAPHAMIVVNAQARILFVNVQAERIFGYSPEELIGRDFETLFPERHRAAHRAELDACLVSPSSSSGNKCPQSFGRRQDGSEVPIEIGLTPFHGSDGLLVLTSVVDMTERRKRELELAEGRAALAHLSRVTMLGELSGSLAHELNQPLTAILSNAQAAQRMMAADDADLAELREILGEIVEDNRRASEVIRRLRVLFRKGDPVMEPADLDSLVAEVVNLVHGDAVRRHVKVAIQLSSDVKRIRGDRIQVQQVLINLLLNAFDALAQTPLEDRRVVISANAADSDRVRISVHDNGPGFRGELPETIFEPFYTTKATGMGMGLFVSRSIVESHGGRLRAENAPEGGAVFSFTVPMDSPNDSRQGT